MKSKIRTSMACLLAGFLSVGCVHVKKTDSEFTITRLGGATSFTGAQYIYENPATGESQRLTINGYKSDLQAGFEQGAETALKVIGKAVAP